MLLRCSVLASLSAPAQTGVGCCMPGRAPAKTNKHTKERGPAVSSQLLLPPAQCLYVSLPALLECNPFQNEGREGWRASPPLPEELRRVVLTYQAVLDLLRQYEVHPEITSQMFAYLFFFSNTLLFNQLLDKGQSSSSSSQSSLTQPSPQSVPVPPGGGPGERGLGMGRFQRGYGDTKHKSSS